MKKPKPSPPVKNCPVKGCRNSVAEGHHVTYDPNERLIALLCSQHHEKITAINTMIARHKHRSLTYLERVAIWKKFLENKIKEPQYIHGRW